MQANTAISDANCNRLIASIEQRYPDIAAEFNVMLQNPGTAALAKDLLGRWDRIVKTNDVETAKEWAALMKESNWDLNAFWPLYQQALDKVHPELKEAVKWLESRRTSSFCPTFISISSEDLEEEPRLK